MIPQLQQDALLKTDICECLNTKTEGEGAPGDSLVGPLILDQKISSASTTGGEIIFYPVIVQSDVGPHLLNWAYASDEQWDAFHSNISVDKEGVRISDEEGKQ